MLLIRLGVPRVSVALLLSATILAAQTPPQRPHILGVAHIAVFAHDYEKSRSFLRGLSRFRGAVLVKKQRRFPFPDLFQDQRPSIHRALSGTRSQLRPPEPHFSRDRRHRSLATLSCVEGNQGTRSRPTSKNRKPQLQHHRSRRTPGGDGAVHARWKNSSRLRQIHERHAHLHPYDARGTDRHPAGS